MKKWFLSSILSVCLFGLSFDFSASSNIVSSFFSASSEEQVIGENNFSVSFDSNGYVSSFKILNSDGSVSFSNNVPWLNGNNSPFDAFDFSINGILKRDISTKIVNKNFWLILAPNPLSGIVKPSYKGFDIYVSVYDMISGKNISNVLHFGATTSSISFPKIFKGFKVTQASKDARIGFLMCAEYGDETVSGSETTTIFSTLGSVTESVSASVSEKVYTIYPYSDCSGEIHSCDWEGKGYRICYSSDNFAVRPYKFLVKNVPSLIKSGEEFNLTIDALDYEGNPTKEYNETLYIDENNTVQIQYKILKMGADNGNLSLVDNKKFENGEVNATLKYDNVGDLHLIITEIEGSEFASVDSDDTSKVRRFITPAFVNISVIPHHFELSCAMESNSTFYIANINKSNYNMSPILELNITARNKEGEITTNYKSEYYAQPIKVGISYKGLPSEIKRIILIETNTSTERNFSNALNNIIVDITREAFEKSGEANLKFRINFERNDSKPINKFDFSVNNVNVVDANGSEGTINNLEENATFKYERIQFVNVSGYGKELNTTLKYEYWDNEKGWVVDKDYNSSYGDINLSKSIYPNDVFIFTNNIENGVRNISIATTHALPYSSKIHLSVPSWLWYHPLAKPYKDPSNNNLDCLTHPCISTSFEKVSKGWAGIGKSNVKYSETNRTSKTNSSNIKADTKSFQKINW